MRMEKRVYTERRARFMDAIGDDGVVILTSPGEKARSHDTNYPYRPSSDIVYLSGFEEPETVLVFAPGHDLGAFVMFVRPNDAEKEVWDGARAGLDGATSRFGADVAYAIEDLDKELPKYLEGRETLYYTLGDDEAFDRKIARWMNKLRFRRGKAPAAPRVIADTRDVLHEMRVRKTADELAMMREAAKISSEAHIIAMKTARPGLHEYEVQAAMEHHFRMRGANFPAYTSIVGGGHNATVLHYVENRDRLENDDVLLIDAGCEYEFYAADITRSFPVSGKFTPEQRDAYQLVLEAQKAAIDDVRVGVRYNELQERTARRLTDALVQLQILSGSVDENIESEAYKQFYPHRVGHWLGMDVHDVGSYYDARGAWRELEPGMVVTVEPGLYFSLDADVPEGFRGLGIRIEDDIVVTESGPENLTVDCPKEIVDMEAIIGMGTN